MTPSRATVGILHYSAPPVVGGVEAVMLAHAQLLDKAGYRVAILAGRGEAGPFPPGVQFHPLPLLDSQHARVAALQSSLDNGEVPTGFDDLRTEITRSLEPFLAQLDHLIVHNIFTKHFNLPLTAALADSLEEGKLRHAMAWCHDFSWTSTSSRSKVHPGAPWDLLRTRLQGLTYVTVSKRRQASLAELFTCPAGDIRLVYNGVDPNTILGLTPEGALLVDRLGLPESDLVLIMPVRVTQAKNIEFALQVLAALKIYGLKPKLVVTGPPDPHDSANMSYYRTLLALRADLDLVQEAHFIYELGKERGGLTIDPPVVADLIRASDLVFMPSHREGFGMPILEAGLASVAVWCTYVPAAVELGGEDVNLFDPEETPSGLADRISTWAQRDQRLRFRRRTKQGLTWQVIFDRDIQPLLQTPLADGPP